MSSKFMRGLSESATLMSRGRLRLVLGSGGMGAENLAEDAMCHKILDNFFSRGNVEVDSALWYSKGNSEKVIGRYFAARGTRDKIIISSKANPFDFTLTKASVLKQASTSLESLQTPHVDIYYLHAPDHNTPVEETLEAVQQLYEEGKFKEFGLCNYAAWEVAEIYYICKNKGWVLPTVYQGMYNPITRMVETELFPALRHFGMRFYAYNPLAGGLLTGRYSKADMDKQQEGRFWTSTVNAGYSKMYRDRFWREATFDGLILVRSALDEVYGKDKVSLISATFRWLNHHSSLIENDGIVFGVSRLEQLAPNIDANEEGPLDQSVVEAFDKAWEMDKGSCVNYFR